MCDDVQEGWKGFWEEAAFGSYTNEYGCPASCDEHDAKQELATV
jgi:hypothetical protein